MKQFVQTIYSFNPNVTKVMKFTAIQAAIRSRAPQIYKVMKLTTFVLVIALVQASAKSFSQKITLHETKAPLEKVITTIKQQSGYEFLYLDQDLKKENRHRTGYQRQHRRCPPSLLQKYRCRLQNRRQQHRSKKKQNPISSTT